MNYPFFSKKLPNTRRDRAQGYWLGALPNVEDRSADPIPPCGLIHAPTHLTIHLHFVAR
jgi:hypothetical protein